MAEAHGNGSMNSSLPAICKLEGRENYCDCKFAMRMYLIHEDLWSCIEGYVEADTTLQHVRERKDQNAMAKICLMVKPAVYSHVRSANTALEAWQNLAIAFEDKGLNRRLRLLRSLCSIKLEKFATMEDYVNEVISLSQKLAAVDKPVDDEFLGAIMLQGLPDDYELMVMALESSGATISSDFVKSKLLQDDKWGAGRDKTESALFAKGRKANPKTVRCWNCGESGHIKPKCPKQILL
ncbi:hypothetical protein J437_LFUL019257 [Ladona fulva]|uniref:CCHC-type domain-containing protein n=1 Tax=Ladona fulva TaxID=123851 RepID=A0A8K0KSS1_LADFU|nr:hypothetical protein J437_LFUL019257 [Ladona fulva]